MSVYLKEDDISDIDKLDEYNGEYSSVYPSFVPFATKENYAEVLKKNDLYRQGIANDGIKEMFYWAIEDNKIVGHASIRLNPEDNEGVLKYSGHIMYGVVPSKRGLGYGTLLCHLLIEKMNELGYKDIIITCSDDNIGSIRVIENNFGELLEIVDPDMEYADKKTRRYKIDVAMSLEKYKDSKKVK
jgi:predicted acetyltransferase